MRPRALLVVAVCSGLLVACPKTQPDPDGQPGGALWLEVGSPARGELDCPQADCSDWYRVQVPGAGQLRVALRGDASMTATELSIADDRGRTLQTQPLQGGAATLSVSVPAGVALIAVASREPPPSCALSRGPAHAYELEARFIPSAPPPPRYTQIEASVLEVESSGDRPHAVLIDQGRSHGLRPGLRGRLQEGGQNIGEIELQDVYDEGSRARIDGTLSAPIRPSTRAIIQVPVGSR